MSDVKRYDTLHDEEYNHTVEESAYGQYVTSSDYDALVARYTVAVQSAYKAIMLLSRWLTHYSHIGQILSVVEGEWKAAGCWSEWDQSVFDEQRALGKATDEFCGENAIAQPIVLASAFDALAAENVKLREALGRYGDHEPPCHSWDGRQCSCGFDFWHTTVQPSGERT